MLRVAKKNLHLLLLLLLALGTASLHAHAAEERTGRAYLMKGALQGGPPALDDIVTSFAFGTRVAERLYVDLVYKNEGHAVEGHRDGFGIELLYRLPLGTDVSAELGGGFLATFNTTRRDGIEVNEKQRGLIGSAALLYRLREALYLRAQYDHVQSPASFRTHTFLLGLQFDATLVEREGARSGHERSASGTKTEAALLVGVSMLNTSAARGSLSVQLELRRALRRDLACSVSVLRENDSRVANREAAAAQCWYLQQLSPDWRAAAGLGPMVIVDHKDDADNTRLGALLSIEAGRRVGRASEAGLRFSRLAVPTVPARDSDLFLAFGRVRF